MATTAGYQSVRCTRRNGELKDVAMGTLESTRSIRCGKQPVCLHLLIGNVVLLFLARLGRGYGRIDELQRRHLQWNSFVCDRVVFHPWEEGIQGTDRRGRSIR
jgi:hypothetical protein